MGVFFLTLNLFLVMSLFVTITDLAATRPFLSGKQIAVLATYLKHCPTASCGHTAPSFFCLEFSRLLPFHLADLLQLCDENGFDLFIQRSGTTSAPALVYVIASDNRSADFNL